MNKLFWATALVTLITLNSYAQLIPLFGKITDATTSQPIPGASVRIARSVTSTNNLGEFSIVLNQPDAVQFGVTVTCIGYQTKHIAYQQSDNYSIKLQPASNMMHEVIISATAESIIQKAIRKIPQNYPDKDFNMEGILRMEETTRDSAGAYLYYKNDAAIRMFCPAYTHKDEIQVSLIQNRYIKLSDPKHRGDSSRWLEGYLVPAVLDIVHTRVGFITLNGMKHYTYTNQGKTYVNNTRVYQVNFFSQYSLGTLYIDTASYAFVSATYTRLGANGSNFKTTNAVNYKRSGGLWYLDNIKRSNTGIVRGIKSAHPYGYAFSYKTTLIDTTKAEQISYHDRLQHRDENIKFNKKGADADWAKYKTLFAQSEQDSLIVSMPVPKVDTTPKTTGKSKFGLSNIIAYLLNDNVRSSIQLSRVPLCIAYYQPLLSHPIQPIAVYTAGVGEQLRLYKALFFGFDLERNFGSGGIGLHVTNANLIYNFEFNKQHHPVTLSPEFGYTEVILKKNGTELFNQVSLAYGLTFAYEVKHWLSYTIGVKYLEPVNTTNAVLLLNNQNFYPSIGLLYKLK